MTVAALSPVDRSTLKTTLETVPVTLRTTFRRFSVATVAQTPTGVQ